MSDIDPIEFGTLKAEVTALRRELDDMRDDIKHLVGMAERSKGALFAGMTIASGLGAIASWVIGKLLGH